MARTAKYASANAADPAPKACDTLTAIAAMANICANSSIRCSGSSATKRLK
jgi:hypothetical protein